MSDIDAPTASNSPRVLIVEDDPIFGHVLEAGLMMGGICVEWSRDGNHALRVFQPKRYDALLIDLGLPTVGGLDVVRQIRRKDPDVPILIVTGDDTVAKRVRGLELGADDYILKPFEMREVLARIRAVKRRRSGSAPTGGGASDTAIGSDGAEARSDVELTPHELAVAGLLLSHRSSLSAVALAILLREQGEILSLAEVEACLATLQAKVEGSRGFASEQRKRQRGPSRST